MMLKSLVLTALFGVLACTEGAQNEGQSKRAGGEAAKACLTDCAPPEQVQQEPETGNDLGLAAFCSYATNEQGQGCFTCTPRELPNVTCVKVDAGFEPASMCEHDLDQLSCRIGSEDFVLDFSTRSQSEDVYEKIPLFLVGAKALFFDRLKDKPAIRDALAALLDAISEHRLEIFTGNVAVPADVLAKAKALVLALAPGATDAELAALEAGIKETIAALKTEVADGHITYARAFALFKETFAKLPDGAVKTGLASIDTKPIDDAIKNLDSDDPIESLLAALKGNPEIEALLDQFINP